MQKCLNLEGVQEKVTCYPFLHLLAKSMNILGHPIFSNYTAYSSYSQAIQDGWLACLSLHFIAKNTKSLGHPIFYYHTALRYSGGYVGFYLLPLMLKNQTVVGMSYNISAY